MIDRLAAFVRRHRHSEEVAAEAVGLNVLWIVLRAAGVFGAGFAAAAIFTTSTYHPAFSLSNKGAAFITRHEGVRYRPYNDPSARPACTVGVGHVLAFRACTTAELATTYTPAQVSALLMHDVSWAETCARNTVSHEISQPQFDALVDLIFNAGCGVMSYSGIASEINRGDLAGVPHTLSRTAVTAGGRYLAGLYTRRLDEGALFAGGYYGAGIGYYRPAPAPGPAKIPSPVPTWAWKWVEWRLGRGIFKGHPADPALRHLTRAPLPVPGWAWLFLKHFTVTPK